MSDFALGILVGASAVGGAVVLAVWLRVGQPRSTTPDVVVRETVVRRTLVREVDGG